MVLLERAIDVTWSLQLSLMSENYLPVTEEAVAMPISYACSQFTVLSETIPLEMETTSYSE